MKIAELAALTGVAERQVRYLIAEGFIPAPHGGRAHADYGDDHVKAIGRYTRLRDLGFRHAHTGAAARSVRLPGRAGRGRLRLGPARCGPGGHDQPAVFVCPPGRFLVCLGFDFIAGRVLIYCASLKSPFFFIKRLFGLIKVLDVI